MNEAQTMLLDHPVFPDIPRAELELITKCDRLLVTFFSRQNELDSKTLAREIKRKFKNLNLADIDHVFENIIDSKTDIKPFYTASEVIRVLSYYDVEKANFRREFFKEFRKDQQTAEERQQEYAYLQKALRSYSNGEPINIYQRSAIGQYFEDKIENTEMIADLAKDNVAGAQRYLNLVHASRQNENKRSNQVKSISELSAGIYPEVSPHQLEPMAWTYRMLYGLYLFNEVAEPRYERFSPQTAREKPSIFNHR